MSEIDPIRQAVLDALGSAKAKGLTPAEMGQKLYEKTLADSPTKGAQMTTPRLRNFLGEGVVYFVEDEDSDGKRRYFLSEDLKGPKHDAKHRLHPAYKKAIQEARREARRMTGTLIINFGTSSFENVFAIRAGHLLFYISGKKIEVEVVRGEVTVEMLNTSLGFAKVSQVEIFYHDDLENGEPDEVVDVNASVIIYEA